MKQPSKTPPMSLANGTSNNDTALAGMIKRHALVRVKVPDVGRDARVTAYSLGEIK